MPDVNNYLNTSDAPQQRVVYMADIANGTLTM